MLYGGEENSFTMLVRLCSTLNAFLDVCVIQNFC